LSEQPRQRRNLRLIQATLAGVLAVPSVSACSSDHARDQYANCVNAQGQVVADYYCDDNRYYGSGGGGGFFIFMAATHYSSGAFVPSGSRSSFINPGDSAARSRAGLPSTGKVGGTTVRSGGIGKGSGSSGSSKSGGSSSHSSGS
jgi:hypothetical protein